MRHRISEHPMCRGRHAGRLLGIEPAMFSLRVLPRSITPRRFSSARGFVFRYFSIRPIGSITGVGSENSFMMKINNVSRHAHRLCAE
jgi:hypothetical protein